MQAHIRKIFVQLTYEKKAKEKACLASIQRNIKIYYRVRDWPWMQFYQLVLGETANIRKKQLEAERKKKMQEGIDKIKELTKSRGSSLRLSSPEKMLRRQMKQRSEL